MARRSATRPKIVHDPKLFELVTLQESSQQTSSQPTRAKRRARRSRRRFQRAASVRSARRHRALFLSSSPDHRESRISRSRPAPSESNAFRRARRARRFSLPPRARAARRSRKARSARALRKNRSAARGRSRAHGAPRRARRAQSARRHVDSAPPASWPRWKKASSSSPASNSKSIRRSSSPKFFSTNSISPCRAACRAKARSTAAEVLEELARVHELPKKVMEYREIAKLEIHLLRCAAELIDPRSGRMHTRVQPDRHGHRPPQLLQSQSAKYSHSHRAGPRNPRRLRRRRGQSAAFRRLFADRAAPPRSFFRRSGPHRSLPPRRRHPLAHRAGGFRRRALRANQRASPRRQGHQFRHHLRPLRLRPGPQSQHRPKRSRQIHRRIFRTLQRRQRMARSPGRRNAHHRRHPHPLRPHPPHPGNHFTATQLRNFAERTAMNTPLQGTAADLIKLAMIEIDRRLPNGRFRIANDPASPRRTALRRPRKRNAAPQQAGQASDGRTFTSLRVPLVVDIKVGPNWRDME